MLPLSVELALLTEDHYREEIIPRAMSSIVPFGTDGLNLPISDVKLMQDKFRETKNFPDLLITHNGQALQHAYTAVPKAIWEQKVTDLEIALQYLHKARRNIMVSHVDSTDIMPWVMEQLNTALREKYEELAERVKNDMHSYFPYHVKSTSPKLMVFEKMNQLELVRYVMQQF